MEVLETGRYRTRDGRVVQMEPRCGGNPPGYLAGVVDEDKSEHLWTDTGVHLRKACCARKGLHLHESA